MTTWTLNDQPLTNHEQPAQDREEIMKEVLTFIDWFHQGDPLHRRRMSSYGATYFRSLLAFLLSINWTPTQPSRQYHLP